MSLKTDEIQKKLERIKIFLFDLQGVLIPENDDGKNVSNELIEKLEEFADYCEERNLKFGIITGMTNEKILESIESIGNVEVVSASLDKVSAAEKIASGNGLSLSETFYMGDGLLDVPLFERAGLSAAPEKAERRIKKKANFICPGNSGSERLDFVLRLLKNIKAETSAEQ